MKQFKYIYLGIALSMLVSCSSDLTDMDNLGVQTAGVYFNDPDNALAALNSVYSSMAKDKYYAFGDIMSDDALKGGSDLFDWVDRQDIKDFNAISSNGVAGDAWKVLYEGIVRSNEIINTLPTTTIEEPLKLRIVAEAKFLRAYAYSKLVPLFGAVPLVLNDLDPDNLEIGRTSETEIYVLIKQDLDDAIANLPRKSEYALADLGRATKGAAQALKARVLMQETGYQYNSVLAAKGVTVNVAANWDEIYTLTNAIETSGEYDLASNYATLFEQEGENNVESVFEVQYETTNLEWGESVGNQTIVEMGNRDDWGWCFNLPTDALYNTYSSKDPRRESSIYGQEFDVLYGTKQTWEKQIWTLEHASTKDYVTKTRLNRKYALQPALRNGNHNNQPNNGRVIRYADVLLMHAEAAYRKGMEGEARDYVNRIRSRAQNATYPLGSKLGQTSGFTYDVYPGASVPPIASSGAALLDDIWKERRMEFAMEGMRYFDLIRTGRQSLLSKPGAYQSHDGLLPLPIADVNSFGLEQNKNY